MGLLDHRCKAPKDPRPGVTTYFCVLERGHDGAHSWALMADVRAARVKVAQQRIDRLAAPVGVPDTDTAEWAAE